METPSSSKFVILLVGALVVGGLIGVAADPYLPASLSSAKKGYADGFAAARKVAEESKYGDFFRSPTDIRYVSGPVTAIDGNRLTIRVQESNPFDGLTESDRTVNIDANTNVYKLEPKDATAYEAELAAFQKSLAGKVAGAEPPLKVTAVPFDLSSIKVDMVIVAVANENIKTKQEFTATEIQVQPKVVFGPGK